jgi:predicted DNA-binding transcriptional regulator AlpA
MSGTPRAVDCSPPTTRGLSREGTAAYIGVSPSLFDQMVKDGRMPLPKRINSRTVWDIRAVDRAFDRLPGGANETVDDWEVET